MRTDFLVCILMLALMTGCATSSDISNGLKLDQKRKIVFVSDHLSGYAERHIGEVVRVLENHGFGITNNSQNAKYALDFNIEGGATLTVSIGLLQDGKKIIDVESTNVWFGTVMFRPIAVANRVESALEEFDTVLSKI